MPNPQKTLARFQKSSLWKFSYGHDSTSFNNGQGTTPEYNGILGSNNTLIVDYIWAYHTREDADHKRKKWQNCASQGSELWEEYMRMKVRILYGIWYTLYWIFYLTYQSSTWKSIPKQMKKHGGNYFIHPRKINRTTPSRQSFVLAICYVN